MNLGEIIFIIVTFLITAITFIAKQFIKKNLSKENQKSLDDFIKLQEDIKNKINDEELLKKINEFIFKVEKTNEELKKTQQDFLNGDEKKKTVLEMICSWCQSVLNSVEYGVKYVEENKETLSKWIDVIVLVMNSIK